MRKETIYKITYVLVLSLPLIALGAIDYPSATAQKVVEGIGKILGAVAAIIGAVFIAIGLFKFATSGGDPRALDEAKISLIWGGVGIVIGVALISVGTILGWFGVSWTTI